MTPQRVVIVTVRVAVVRVDVPLVAVVRALVRVIRAAQVGPALLALLATRPVVVIVGAVRVAVAGPAAAVPVLVSVLRLVCPACLALPACPALPVVPRAIATAVVARVPAAAPAVPVVVRVPAAAPAARAAKVLPALAPAVRVVTTAARARQSIPTRRSIRTRP